MICVRKKNDCQVHYQQHNQHMQVCTVRELALPRENSYFCESADMSLNCDCILAYSDIYVFLYCYIYLV